MNEFEYRDSWNGDMMLPDTSYQDYGDVVETFPEHSFTAMQSHPNNYGEREFEMITLVPHLLSTTTWDFFITQPNWLVEKELQKIKNNP